MSAVVKTPRPKVDCTDVIQGGLRAVVLDTALPHLRIRPSMKHPPNVSPLGPICCCSSSSFSSFCSSFGATTGPKPTSSLTWTTRVRKPTLFIHSGSDLSTQLSSHVIQETSDYITSLIKTFGGFHYVFKSGTPSHGLKSFALCAPVHRLSHATSCIPVSLCFILTAPGQPATCTATGPFHSCCPLGLEHHAYVPSSLVNADSSFRAGCTFLQKSCLTLFTLTLHAHLSVAALVIDL